jgi:hypothetical protein
LDHHTIGENKKCSKSPTSIDRYNEYMKGQMTNAMNETSCQCQGDWPRKLWIWPLKMCMGLG